MFAGRFSPIGANDSQGLDPILLCYRTYEQNTVWENNYSNAALNADLVHRSGPTDSFFTDLNLQFLSSSDWRVLL